MARTLNEVGPSLAGGFGRLRTARGQAALAVTQVALAVVLLTGAGVLLRGFVSLVTLDIGFEPASVVEARITDTDGLRDGPIGPDEIRARHLTARHELETLLARLERIAALPGVEAVAVSSSELLYRTGAVRPFEVVGRRTAIDPRDQLRARILNVSPEYADAARLRLLAGRFFTDRDRAGSPRVVVVSESFARAAFGGNPALGQRLVSPSPRIASVPAVMSEGDAKNDDSWEVIGIMEDIVSPLDLEPFAPDDGDVFMSILQTRMDEMSSLGNTLLVVVRTVGDPLAVLAWRLSNTMDTGFCIEALEAALRRGTPEIFNTDQGAQFTSAAFTERVLAAGAQCSMDGRGRCLDNVFIERLWRSLKYEAVYLHELTDGFEAERVLGAWMTFYSDVRPHSALGGRTPAEAYGEERAA